MIKCTAMFEKQLFKVADKLRKNIEGIKAQRSKIGLKI
jgi:hypothetical protein